MKKILLLSLLLLISCSTTHNNENTTKSPDIYWDDTGKGVFEPRENYSVTEAKYCISKTNDVVRIKPCYKP
jgi:hypothetical protein